MNRRETATLLHLAATLDGRMRRALTAPDQAAATIAEWTDALAHVPATTVDGTWDATHAVRRFYEQRRGDQTARYFAFEPHHLLAAWAEHRATRMERHTDPVPVADPDDEAAYRTELAEARGAVATGQAAPNAYRAAIDPAGQRRLAALTDAAGHSSALAVPPETATLLGQVGLGKRRRVLPALGLPCPVPTCRARERHYCTTPKGQELRRNVHGGRRDAWAQHSTTCPECGAEPGWPCSTPEPHPARIRAALAT